MEKPPNYPIPPPPPQEEMTPQEAMTSPVQYPPSQWAVQSIPPKYQIPPQKYPQPNYPQPNYPQPNYPQPNYPQPNYPQPNYTQPNYQYPNQAYKPYATYPKPKSKWTEAIIGKYLVGIIAALLVFAAAISFIILLWDGLMTDLAIFIIVLVAGLAILATGFIRLHKHKNAITSILIGTGAGLVFIALAAGHIAFQLINELTAIGLVLLWSAGLLLSFKYSRLFFTSIIAYTGGFIALMFFYTRVTASIDFITTLIFMFIILGVFLISTSLWMDKLKQYIAGIMSLALPFSFIVTFADNQLHRNHNSTLFICMIVCCVLIYWLYSYIRYSIRNNLTGLKGIALEATALIAAYSLFATFLPVWNPAITGLIELVGALVATGIIGVTLIFMYKHSIVAMLTFIYAAVLTVSKFSSVAFPLPVLGVLTLATFFLKDARFNGKKIVTLCLTYICFLSIIINGPYNAYNESLLSNIIYITGTLSTAAVSLCLVFNYYKNKAHIGLIINAKISAFVITAVLISILGALIVSYRYIGRPYNLTDTVFLTVMTAICLSAFLSGFFLDWRNEGAFPYRNKEIKRYSFDLSGILAFSFIFILYAACLFIMITNIPWYLKLINTFAALCVLAVQSYIIVGRFKTNPFSSIATGVICLIFGWVFLYGWFGAGLNTLEASIVGMALAFVSIFIGVMLRISAYRIFGLVLTLCMTAKAILLDFAYTDGVTRVVALLIGGIICFGISIVYSKLETSLKQNQNPDGISPVVTFDLDESTDTVTTQKVVIKEEINDVSELNDTSVSE